MIFIIMIYQGLVLGRIVLNLAYLNHLVKKEMNFYELSSTKNLSRSLTTLGRSWRCIFYKN